MSFCFTCFKQISILLHTKKEKNVFFQKHKPCIIDFPEKIENTKDYLFVLLKLIIFLSYTGSTDSKLLASEGARMSDGTAHLGKIRLA